MKRNVAKFVSTIVFGTICMMTACSGEEFEEIVVEDFVEDSHWQCADINLYVNRISFDAETGTTRSVDDGWKHGDRIYLILKNNAGNNVQAYVEYDTLTASWGQVKYDAYKSELTCTTPRMVEAYYFDGTVNVNTSDITFDAATGVYACTDGIYTYPANGNLEVSISLAPLTSRIRFTGEKGTQLDVTGMTTYTGFSRTTGELSVTTSDITTSVQSSGYTPYVYGVFSYPSTPSLVVKNGSKYFRTIFDSSTNVLQVGHSGYMAVPTTDSHNGWKLVIPTTGISINQSSLVLNENETASLMTTISPSNATPSAIIWSSSDNSVATVSDAGVVTAVGLGQATITATVKEYPNVKATCSIRVKKEGEETIFPDWTSTNKNASSTSSYTYTIDAVSGDVLTFDWLVSSELDYDVFIATLDGVEILKKSGEVSGSYRKTFTASGTYKLIVKYTKDGSSSKNSDYAKVYNVYLNK